MRLKRLDLARYGKFTDRRIDFGERAPGRPDLHLVYGPNEAGKSTAFAGFLDLLFGIETRSRYNFLHPYGTMQVGGALELSGGPQDLIRTKRNHGSLLDGQGRPVSEALIQGELGSIDRAAYRTMFSLDDETLEAGGNSILASKGDLGQLLFSGSSGLADLGRRLADLRLEADGFHKPKKHGTALAELKGRLAELKARKDGLDTFASAYAQLIAARDRARDGGEAARRARGAARARMDEIGRLLGALPRRDDLRAAREQLALLANLPDLPPGWGAALPEVERREIEGAAELKGIDAEIEALTRERAEVAVDGVALGLAPRLDRLGDARARAVTAAKDLPTAERAAAAAAQRVADLVARLGQGGDAGALVLGAATVGMLRGMMEAQSGIVARREAAEAERDDAARTLAEAEARLSDAGGGSGADLSRLSATVAAVRGGDQAARRLLAERALPGLRETLDERLRDLRPWAGTLAELADLALPDLGAFEALVAGRAEAERRLDREAAEATRLAGERLRLRAEVDALGEIAGVVGDREAAALRAARDRAWSDHRRIADIASADAFEDLMRRDDIVTGARFGQAADVAKLRAVHLTLATLEVDLAAAEARRDAARAERDRVDDALRASLAATVPPLPGGPTPALGAFLVRRRDALAAAAAVRRAERERDDAEADIAAARRRIGEALDGAGVPHDPAAGLESLLASAGAVVDREAGLRALRETVEAHRRDAAARAAAWKKATAAEAAWTAAWEDACRSCWLGTDGIVPSVAAVREVLKVLGDLGPALGLQADAVRRVAALEEDRRGFTAEVLDLADVMGAAHPDAPAAVLDDEMLRRVADARRDEARRAALDARLAAARERCGTAAEAQAAVLRRRDEMTAVFAVTTLAEVGRGLRDVERRDALRERVTAAERDIRAALRTADAAEAEAALDGLDPAALERERAELEPVFDEEDRRMREFHAEHAKAHDAVEAVGGDDAVARLEEERRTVLLDIEERARHYLRLRAGVAAAEGALRAYRDRHRSEMMRRASEAFRTVSRDYYSGLATQPEKDAEILMAVAADGGTKTASDLSKGTRFQLYLALRIAGYHEFARTRPAVPFVADDIMETFDDFRAEEAFRLFAGMAEVGQVIYLTHHRHLIDVAREACPTVTVHRLDAA